MDCRGGQIKDVNGQLLNTFGEAFRDAGYQWTQELCEADSDGDGRSNGQELGDPCCVWTPGQPLPGGPAYITSHPGFTNDTNAQELPSAAECEALRVAGEDASGESGVEAIDALFADNEERHEVKFTCVQFLLRQRFIICMTASTLAHNDMDRSTLFRSHYHT